MPLLVKQETLPLLALSGRQTIAESAALCEKGDKSGDVPL